MENAQLIGLSRQTALRHQMDVIANNLSNINTAGFKGQHLVFEEYLMPVAKADAFADGDQTLSYVMDYKSSHDLRPGATMRTGNPLDVAIDGKGWFVVETPQGERYTRDGGFSLNPAGELITKSGLKVLGAGGPIVIGPGEKDLTIAADGTVSTSAGQKGKLRLVQFEDPKSVAPVGGNLFKGEDPQPVPFAKVRQGVIEKSNVRSVLEITRMIEVTRAYQSVSSLMKEQAKLHTDAIQKLGTLQA